MSPPPPRSCPSGACRRLLHCRVVPPAAAPASWRSAPLSLPLPLRLAPGVRRNFDGSSTGQAPGHDSEVLLKPVRLFPDPFRGAPHLLVLSECLTPAGEPIPTNTRNAAKKVFDAKLDEEPWFGECPRELPAGTAACVPTVPWRRNSSWQQRRGGFIAVAGLRRRHRGSSASGLLVAGVSAWQQWQRTLGRGGGAGGASMAVLWPRCGARCVLGGERTTGSGSSAASAAVVAPAVLGHASITAATLLAPPASLQPRQAAAATMTTTPLHAMRVRHSSPFPRRCCCPAAPPAPALLQAWSRSTRCSTWTRSRPSGGPRAATPAPRAPTTAPRARTSPSAARSWRRTTRRASTRASRSRA